MTVSPSLYDAHQTHLEALRRQRRSPATLKAYTIYCGGFLRFLQERGSTATVTDMERKVVGVPETADDVFAHGALDSLTRISAVNLHARCADDPVGHEPSLPLALLSPALVGEYQDHIRAHSKGTRDGAVAERQAVGLLKTWATWLWRREYFPTDPLARLDPPRLAKLHRVPFSEIEVRRLLDAARMGPNPIMERALLLLGLDTGARIGELVGASVDDLDLDAGSILFRKTKNGRPRRVFFGVASRADGGPCVSSMREWLSMRPSSEAPNLFVDSAGWPLSTSKARRLYHALGESAGVEQAIPHRARHTHATAFLAAAPGAEHALRSRLGQLSPEVMGDYISISDLTAQKFAELSSLSARWAL